MEGNRGVLEKQQIITRKNKKLQLTVNLSSNETDLLRWQCAVFTENKLRALAPVTSLSSSTSNDTSTSTENSTATNSEDIMTQDSHLMVIVVACAVTGCVLILLLGLLVLKYQRKTGADSWFKTNHASSEDMLDCSTTVIYSASTAQ